jgi:intracellular septation protein A
MDYGFNKHKRLKVIIIKILINVFLPLATYFIASIFISKEAVYITALIPLATIIVTLIKKHKLNIISSVLFIFIIIGVCLSLLTGDNRFMLIKASPITGLLGVVLIISSMINKPLLEIFIKARSKQLNINNEKANLNILSKQQLNLTNGVIGIILLCEAMLHVFLVYHMSATRFIEITPMIKFTTLGIYALSILWIRKMVKS